MSFITKRERVFNEYDLFDLPARNEGKLKAYSSCTDARAWSHFCSDKTEHLVEIIKRNNETHRPKYIPTDVIVNTLMMSKNSEIARLKRKIGEFEQMLAVYEDLDLTCEQKCDIANAHAAIKAANKELDEMCLDLDLSGFTEGIDSEAFETGKSRGDEPSRYTGETGKSRGDEWTMGKASTPRMETKSNQIGNAITTDASTSAHDNRIDELQEIIICKDAKLNAMQNTIAVMENDVCEPYCIYAHIYTALEKIFGVLCQNEKYKQYLDLLTNGKDTRCLDVKGKILFKMKVLEKFSLALIAPCSQDSTVTKYDCSCYRAEIVTRLETAFALTTAETKIPSLDTKRAHLVADIMQNDDMKEILSKESLSVKIDDDQLDECIVVDNDSINVKNLKRLKNLQMNYDDLLNCYDNLKHERDSLNVRCQKYFELENEFECLQTKLREYNELWKDKEFYRKRSEDLDALKQNYYVLSEETANIETKLNAEQEINKNKSAAIDELRNENVKLENKISEISLSYEKQRNVLICKLKECECKMMCQEQQIKSLTNQIDSILNGEKNNILQNEDDTHSMQLMNEIKSQKEQIINLKDALCCTEEEKQYFQEEFDKKLEVINELKQEIEAWKSKYEETNNYLGNYLEKCQMEINELQDSNSSAMENLNYIINSKSREINVLTVELDRKNIENENLVKQVKNIYDDLENKVSLFECEKKIALNSINSAKKESLEILQTVKNYEYTNNEESNESLEIQFQRNKSPTRIVDQGLGSDNVYFLKEIQLLRDINLESVNHLQNENIQLKRSFEAVNNETERIKRELLKQEDIIERFNKLKESHENLLNEKECLQNELNNKTYELDNVLHAFQLTKKESETLTDQLHKSECFQEEYLKLNESHQKILTEKNCLQNKLSQVKRELNDSMNAYKNIKEENELLHLNLKDKISISESLSNLKDNYKQLKDTNNILQKDYYNKTSEILDLYNLLEHKNKDIEKLQEKIKILENQERQTTCSINFLESESKNMKLKLSASSNNYAHLEKQFNDLSEAYEKLKLEKENLQKDLKVQLEDIKKLEIENCSLNNESKTLLIHNGDLEKALMQVRDENTSKSDSIHICYQEIKKEIENLREEKISYHKKITDLMDKLEESEFLTSDLSERVINKDKKISTLENHINELEDEIRKLQHNLNAVIESGEQIRQLSYDRIDQSFKAAEAHHSKATHNMKLELAKMQNKNQNEVDSSKSTLEEFSEDENKYIGQMEELKKERQEIVSQIRDLEIKYLGDTNLPKVNSTKKDVIVSLDRINTYISEKNSSLEKTLSNVQASYQLLKAKAHEAKKIAEKERQNIINEKEEIYKERRKLEEMIDSLKNDKVNYERVINDLKGEIMNQKLIFNKVKQLHESDITKLKEEKISLQERYGNSLNSIEDLQGKLNTECMEKNNYLDHIEKAKSIIAEKNIEISKLQTNFEEIKNKPTNNTTTQTVLLSNMKDIYSQTETQSNSSEYTNENNFNILTTSIENASDLLKLNKEQGNLNLTDFFKTEDGKLTIDCVKYIYINYKVKKLSLGRLEQYSITNLHDEVMDDKCKTLQNVFYVKSPISNNLNSSLNNDSVIDISSTQIFTSTTKNTCENENFSKDQPESFKSHSLINKENKIFDNEFDSNNSFKENMEFDISPTSTDKQMFVIYDDQANIENKSWTQNVIVERAVIHRNEEQHPKTQKIIKYKTKEAVEEMKDDDNLKPQLKINLPIVFTDPSTTTISDADTKSLDSYNRSINRSSKWVHSDTKINSNSSKNREKLNTAYTTLNLSDDQNIDHNKKYINSNIDTKMKRQIKSFKRKQYTGDDVDTTNTRQLEKNSPVKSVNNSDSNLNLSRINGNTAVLKGVVRNDINKPNDNGNKYDLKYVLKSIQNDFGNNNNHKFNNVKLLRKSYSEKQICLNSGSTPSDQGSLFKLSPTESITVNFNIKPETTATDRGILVKLDIAEVNYQKEIQQLTDALDVLEKHYKKKLDAVKTQYENNIKHIISEHNQGVENIQYLHEEAVHEIINKHGNEIENLRSMSIEAMRKAEKLGNENRCLKSKLNNNMTLDEIPVKILTPELKKKKGRPRTENKTLTKTIVDAFNVKPKKRSHGPCTCSLDINISDTIRNIFEKVDADQRKMAELAYLKYIAKKILSNNVDVLDAQELSFLHLKVCRIWKARLNNEETLRKRIDSLQSELINKQRQTQINIADLDRKVAQEWSRLQEVREAVCRGSPCLSRDHSPQSSRKAYVEKDACDCNIVSSDMTINEKHSTGQIDIKICSQPKPKRGKLDTHRAVGAKLDVEHRREKKLYNDETPTRLKRSHDRPNNRSAKK